MREIQLIPVGEIDMGIPEFLALALSDVFRVPCVIRRHDIRLEPAYSPERKQYHSTRILAQLLRYADGPERKLLGVAGIDLYIPILTFVFGEAQLGRPCAVVSSYRLHQQFYGLPGDQILLYGRCEKEAVHELGHTLGLVHCPDFECVMHYSNSIEAIDLKGRDFCPGCARLLGL